MHLSVVVPCFNEEGNIADVVHQAAEVGRILVVHDENRGYGAAVRQRMLDADAIATKALRFQELLVGRFEKIFGGVVVRLPFGYAHTHRDLDARPLEFESSVSNEAVDLSCELAGAIETHLWSDQRELLPTNARDHVVLTQAPEGHGTELPQNGVARQVAERVVDMLEVVDVEHQERERALVALGACDLFIQHLIEIPLVVQLGEAVGRHQPIDLLVVLDLDVITYDELQNRAADFQLVAVPEATLLFDEVIVDVRSIGRVEVANAEHALVEPEAAVVARDALLVDLNFALRGAPDDKGFSGDVDPAPYILPVDHDQTSAVALLPRSASRRRLGQHRLTRAGRLISELHPSTIQRHGRGR